MNGILLVDKPQGMTSHDVVDKIRRAAKQRRVGHTGTLDPSATGLLILCLGHATRLSEFFTGMDKTYEGVMRLGIVTDSHDLDGAVLDEKPYPEHLSEQQVRSTLEQFTGDILQVPPMVSAVKVAGERLYIKARKGEVVHREPRPVRVYEFEPTRIMLPEIAFRVRCSRGTYARTLCHDVGTALGCGASLARLRRTEVGRHSIHEAHTLDQLTSVSDVEQFLQSPDTALDLPEVHVKPICRTVVASGGVLGFHDLTGPCPVTEGWVQIKEESGELLAVGEVDTHETGVRIRPKRVLCGQP
ncbi:MAG: tRNA pseudouridine synthase B [Candidatus Hydrogenedentota bacterium]